MSRRMSQRENNSKNCNHNKSKPPANIKQSNLSNKAKPKELRRLTFASDVVDFDGPRNRRNQPNSNTVPGKRGATNRAKESYSSLIMRAINSTNNKMMTLGEIYDWFLANASHYGLHCDPNSKGWRNSIRHNLSLQRKFRRIPPVRPNRAAHWKVVNVPTLCPNKFFEKYFKLFPEIFNVLVSFYNQNTFQYNNGIGGKSSCVMFANELLTLYSYFISMYESQLRSDISQQTTLNVGDQFAKNFPFLKNALTYCRPKNSEGLPKQETNGPGRQMRAPHKRKITEVHNTANSSQSSLRNATNVVENGNDKGVELQQDRTEFDQGTTFSGSTQEVPRNETSAPSSPRSQLQNQISHGDKTRVSNIVQPLCANCSCHFQQSDCPSRNSTMNPNGGMTILQPQQNFAPIQNSPYNNNVGPSSNFVSATLQDEGISIGEETGQINQPQITTHSQNPRFLPASGLPQSSNRTSLPPPMQYVNTQSGFSATNNPIILNQTETSSNITNAGVVEGNIQNFGQTTRPLLMRQNARAMNRDILLTSYGGNGQAVTFVDSLGFVHCPRFPILRSDMWPDGSYFSNNDRTSNSGTYPSRGHEVGLNVIEFSADIKTDGLEGVILFIKKNEREPAIIKANLHGRQLPPKGLKWEIRKTPTLHFYGTNNGYCNQAVVNSELYIDFTSTNDLLRSRGVYVNEKIVIDYSNKSILGHSVVLKDGDYLVACATILPANQKHEDVVVYRSRFNQMIGGEIYFIKVNITTIALGYVYGIDSDLFGTSLDWKLVYSDNSKVVGSESYMATDKNRTCSSSSTSSCFIGELGALSELLISKRADNGWASMHHFRHVFPYLDLPALTARALAIKLEPKLKNSSLNILYPLFPLQKIEQSQFQPQLYENENDSIIPLETVNVKFLQPSPYHTTVLLAKIDINSHFLNETTKYPSFTIYNAGSITGNCKTIEERTDFSNSYPPYVLLEENSYETLPPFKNFTDSTMHLEYPVQVSLFGSRSILESILRVEFQKDAPGSSNYTLKQVICGPIKPLKHDGVVHLYAKFGNETGIFGTVDMVQYLFKNEKTDSVIFINVKHESGNRSFGHMVHIHEYVPDTSDQGPHWRCSVTAGHFNPLAIPMDGEYKKLCNEITAFRCQVGDLSGKYGNYNVGYGEMKIVDPTLDLQGKLSPNGRSLVVHGPNGEKEFIGCEAIVLNPSQN